MIVVNTQTQLKIDIISKVSAGKMLVSNAQRLLMKSRRTIQRYVQQYLKNGILFAIHKNSNRTPINKLPDSLKTKVQRLIKEKYFDFNLMHLIEKLKCTEGISLKRETLRRWAHEIHHVKRAKKRRPKIRKRRTRMESTGLLLQMDGSLHRWFGDSESCLIAIIDDANSELNAEFFKSENTLGCMKVLKDLITKKGVFKTLYVDRAGIFGGSKRCNFSQIQRACEELGIEIIFANSPEAKGRIERSFDTLQDRLVPELRINQIINMQEANQYLKKVFIPTYWERQVLVKPENPVSEFSPIPSHINMEDIFVLKEYRKIRNDHTFSYKNSFYLIKSKLRFSIAKQAIEIRTPLNGQFQVYFAGRRLRVSEVVEPTQLSMKDLETKAKKKENTIKVTAKLPFGDFEIKKKVLAIKLAEKLQNVSEAARRSGVSRQSIYKNRQIFHEKGAQALKRTFRKDHYHKNRASKSLESTLIDFSLKSPHLGQVQVSRQLKKHYQIEISPGGVRRIWLRHQMQTIGLRIQKVTSLESSNAA